MNGNTSYFGEPWPSGVCDEGERVQTPVGEDCAYCTVPIGPDDQGSLIWWLDEASAYQVPVHKECSLREVLGGIGHLTNHLRWCVGEHDPDAGLTRRESSLKVWAWVSEHGFPHQEQE